MKKQKPMNISVYAIPGVSRETFVFTVPPETVSSTELFDRVLESVCKYFEIDKNDVLASSKDVGARKKEIALCRHVSMAILMRDKRGFLSHIARYFGRNHATVLYARKRVM